MYAAKPAEAITMGTVAPRAKRNMARPPRRAALRVPSARLAVAPPRMVISRMLTSIMQVIPRMEPQTSTKVRSPRLLAGTKRSSVLVIDMETRWARSLDGPSQSSPAADCSRVVGVPPCVLRPEGASSFAFILSFRSSSLAFAAFTNIPRPMATMMAPRAM